MTHTALLEDDFEYSKVPIQTHFFGRSQINHALTAVAQEVVGVLQHTYPAPAHDSNPARTIMIRAIEQEYGQALKSEPLTERELEVLQLIVNGCTNGVIAQELYISQGAVKSHVCNILKKLYASDRTEAAIRALRSGLVH